MAVTEEIAWGDGSGDKIYLTANAFEGDQTVLVSSDANTGAARTKTVTFTAGLITQTLTVNQEAGTPQQYTITVYPSSYDTVNYSYQGLTNITNAYTASSSTTYGRINLARGTSAETYLYFKFDLSSIPSNATIDSVSLTAKGNVNDGNASRIATKYFEVCRGTTSIGTSQSVTTTAKEYSLNVGTGWTGANIQDLTLKAYAMRGTSNITTSYYFNIYGATLTIKYTI